MDKLVGAVVVGFLILAVVGTLVGSWICEWISKRKNSRSS